MVVFLGLLLIGGVAFGAGAWYLHSLDAGIAKQDPFAQITGGRPVKAVDGALNILVLGTDSRDPDARNAEGRTDTIILLHVTASHDKAYLISIPRDLRVYIPKQGDAGDATTKINAAYSWGGLSLVVQTVEKFTDVRIDHVVLIDFGGFQQVTDALGGVDLDIEQDITSIHQPFRHFTRGRQHLNGAEALDYCRQRYQFAEGDFARVRHQQQFLKALIDKAASGGTLTNPSKLDNFLKSVAKSMTVDKDFSLTDTAWQFHGIRSSDLTFLVSPNLGSQEINGESFVISDKPRALALYEAVGKDTVADWIAHNASASPAVGR